MLPGQMMDFPLTLTHYLRRAGAYYPDATVVWRQPNKSIARTTLGHVAKRCAQLAHALKKLGVGDGDRVATLCWNHGPHLEAYLTIPCIGAVVHTLNLRLHPNELGYIARHAEDKVVIVDRSLLPLLEKFRAQVPSIQHVIVVPDTGPAAENEGLDYETLIQKEATEFAWPDVDEKSAAMLCYTSGTTGNPKGVLYSHRSQVLHTMAVCQRNGLGVGESDTIFPVVPMFHAAAWGLVYGAVASGANLVFPGPHLDPESLLSLMESEKVTFAGGVPTIWIAILAMLDREPKRFDLSAMREMVIGGSAAPPSLIEGFHTRHNLEVLHAWGMTEMSPLGTICRVKGRFQKAPYPEQLKVRATQGYAAAFVETRHVSDTGELLPWDSKSMGELEVRGPWVAKAYFGGDGADRFTKDGWFKTGDVVTIDADGYVTITDRSKDVVKSGGEWISSVALENALMSHPKVLEAAVFAGKHVKYDERPIAAVVLKKGETVTEAELTKHLEPMFAKFWLPDAFVFVEQIPRTSTGKFLKSALREAHGGMLLGKS